MKPDVLHIGLDDTDSLRGGCTTWLATRVIQAFPELDLIGAPQLVRLNPNVPWKTRGNGAVALTLGRGTGEPQGWGALPAGPLRVYRRGKPTGELSGIDLGAALARIREVVAAEARPSAQPGIIVTRTPPPAALYWRGVREIVPPEAVATALAGTAHAGLNGGRGLTGAACALAWPGADHTWELLAYRHRARWGTPRDIAAGVAQVTALPGTFACADPDGRPALVPHSPCPVLWGLRGLRPEPLVEGFGALGPEEPERWLLWRTNQATDDHLQRLPSAELRDGVSVRLRGHVASPPETRRGGHRFFTLASDGGEVRCAAFEPAGPFRHIVDRLVPGDAVEVCGSVGRDTLKLEKLRIVALAPRRRKPPNPLCPACGARTHSAGARAGYRCRACRERLPAPAPEPVAPELAPGWYDPPASARRHLARPASLMAGRD